MALFSRRPKGASDQPAAQSQPEADEVVSAPDPAAVTPEADTPDADTPEADTSAAAGTTEPAAPAAGTTEPAAAEEPAASVDISMSSFRGLGAEAPTQAPAPQRPAPAPTPAPASAGAPPVPGIPDNVLVRDALALLSDPPTTPEVLNVARQLLQGQLYLRVKGDARALLAAGEELSLATITVEGDTYMLAYSSGAALQSSVLADGDRDTSAMGQPVLTLIRNLLAGHYEGLVLDQASAPARAVLSRELLDRLVQDVDEELALKTLLAEERTPENVAAVARALTRVPVWVAVGGADGEALGVAEARSDDGSRLLELYSHPLEVALMGRGDRPAPLSAAQLAGALGSDVGINGVVINPQGPWMRLTRDDLAPLLAIAR
jgi:hypothetical protein